MTPAEARVKLAAEPGKYRAAVLHGTEFPLKEHETTTVSLHELVGGATARFKAVRDSYEALGYRKVFGSAKLGCIRFEKDGSDDVVLVLDKRP